MPEEILTDEVLAEGERLRANGRQGFPDPAKAELRWRYWLYVHGPALIEEVRRLRAENERLQRMVDEAGPIMETHGFWT